MYDVEASAMITNELIRDHGTCNSAELKNIKQLNFGKITLNLRYKRVPINETNPTSRAYACRLHYSICIPFIIQLKKKGVV